MSDQWSRRELMAATGAAVFMGHAQATGNLTVGEVIARIKAHVGVPWFPKTVDGIIVGSPDLPVTGITTAMMANFDVVKATVARGHTLLISHEPTFWSHQEDVSVVKNDPLYHEKLDYIRAYKLTVFHFHDHFHALKPFDGIAVGMNRRLGWTPDADDVHAFNRPPTTLAALAKELSVKLNAKTLRVIGRPDMPVKRVRSSWGYVQKENAVPVFNGDADAFLIGETWEWETQEYAKDLVSAGRNKSLVMVGHIESEQWGMDYCADWLKTFVPEVPVQFLEMPEPYWTPA